MASDRRAVRAHPVVLRDCPGGSRRNGHRGEAIHFALMCLLFALPLAFSFGTNLRCSSTAQMAAVFGITALLIQLQRLCRSASDHKLRPRGLADAALRAAVAHPTAEHLRSAPRLSSAHCAHRPNSGDTGGPREHSTAAGHGDAECDSSRSIQLRTARGSRRAQPVLDLTGDGPGLIYAIGDARLAWRGYREAIPAARSRRLD